MDSDVLRLAVCAAEWASSLSEALSRILEVHGESGAHSAFYEQWSEGSHLQPNS